jgi:hypothetical protein
VVGTASLCSSKAARPAKMRLRVLDVPNRQEGLPRATIATEIENDRCRRRHREPARVENCAGRVKSRKSKIRGHMCLLWTRPEYDVGPARNTGKSIIYPVIGILKYYDITPDYFPSEGGVKGSVEHLVGAGARTIKKEGLRLDNIAISGVCSDGTKSEEKSAQRYKRTQLLHHRTFLLRSSEKTMGYG